MIRYQTHLEGIDWTALRADLIADDFHNGRTAVQLRLSFENSQHVAMGFDGERCMANGRLLSDGVGNAYVLDVWTQSGYRRQGVATEIMALLLAAVPGQHVYLQTDDAVSFYEGLGFTRQPEGMARVVGDYLCGATRSQDP